VSRIVVGDSNKTKPNVHLNYNEVSPVSTETLIMG